MRSTSDELIHTTLELMPDAAVVIDEHGTITHVNDSLSMLFGYGGQEVLGQKIEVLIPERLRSAHRGHREHFTDDPHQRAMGAGLALFGLRRDGTEFPVDVSLAPLVLSSSRSVVAAIRDVSDRVEAEGELRRLLREGERNARWQEITAEIRLRILDEDDLDAVLTLSCEHLAELTGARGVAVALGRQPTIRAATGVARTLGAMCDPAELPAFDGTGPVLRRQGDLDPRLADRIGDLDILVVPIGTATDHPGGLLCLVGDEPDEATVTMAVSFAEQVALAIELDRAKAERDTLLIGDERGRIARDLHDLVIQRLFASGLSLQSIVPLVSDERAAGRLAEVVDELDATIGEIRTTIFTLAPPPHTSSGLRARVLELVDGSTRLLGFEATTRFRGPVDSVVDDDAAHHILAVVREGLANIARHAKASTARIEVTATPAQIEVSIIDNGVGTSAAHRESGLANLRQRAEVAGGSMTIEATQPSGTTLRWKLPLGGSSST